MRCTTGGGLRAILEPDVTLAVWERSLPPEIGAGLDRMPAAGWPSLRVETTAARVRGDLAAAWPDPLPDALTADIVHLVRLYADLTATRKVAVRLETVAGHGCRYFHADSVGIRLLCTYRGAGTLWLPDDAVVRKALGRGDNAAVAPDPSRIRALACGHVGLMKGEAWPRNRGRGLVHRSPPADPRHGPRLLLCFDHAEG
ncbi:DUF1826 domain-containing protein [Azospirillum oleiclasticum]|uniref:DUF1826 domain-containing protein n=1 Tax=Azospirillum oleiclasticum TaxID=2735135 RepID=UPI0031B5B5AF